MSGQEVHNDFLLYTRDYLVGVTTFVRRNPRMVALGCIPFIGAFGMIGAVLWYEENVARPDKKRWLAIQNAEVDRKQAALIEDFSQTDGVDRTQTAERSWLLTVTRPSSVLGGSTPEILARVTERIVRETGCKGVLIAEAYVDRGSGLFYTPKSPVYSVAAVNCPQ